MTESINSLRASISALLADEQAGCDRKHLDGLLFSLLNDRESFRADSLQLQRMAEAINTATPGFKSASGSECDHAEAALCSLLRALPDIHTKAEKLRKTIDGAWGGTCLVSLPALGDLIEALSKLGENAK